jgi:hypothetical protein
MGVSVIEVRNSRRRSFAETSHNGDELPYSNMTANGNYVRIAVLGYPAHRCILTRIECMNFSTADD